jgi:hypothetical protein
MTDIASLSLKVDATQSDNAAKSLDKLTASAAKTETASKALEKSWNKEQQAINARAAAIMKADAMADAQADKAWALANGYTQVGGQIVKASVATEAATGVMSKLGLNTQFAQREMMLLGKEAVTGDFSKIPRTLGTLATHSNILPALISPIGLAIGAVTVAAAAGGYAWYKWGEDAKEASKRVKEALKSAEDDAKEAWAGIQKSAEQQLIELEGRMAGARGQLTSARERQTKVAPSSREFLDIGAEIIARKNELAGLQAQIDKFQLSLSKSQDEQYKKTQEVIKGLKFENEMYGRNAGEIAYYTAIKNGSSEADANKIKLLTEEKTAHEEYNKALKESNAILVNTDPTAKANQEWQKLLDLQKELGDQFPLSAEQMGQAYAKAMEGTANQTAKTASQMSKIWDNFVENTQRALGDTLFSGMSGKFTDIEQVFKDMLLRMAADAAAANIMNAMFGTVSATGGSRSGGLWGTIIGAIAGARAEGGPVNSGSTYLVGERGPELFTPTTSGAIIPNGATGGGTVIHMGDTVINVDSRADRQQVLLDVSRLIDTKQRQQEEVLRRNGAIS